MLSCNELESHLDALSIKYKLLEPKYIKNKSKSIGYKFHHNLTIFIKQTMSNKDDKFRHSGRLVIHPLLLIEIEKLRDLKDVHIRRFHTQSSSYKFGDFPVFMWSNQPNEEPYGTALDFEDSDAFKKFFEILQSKFDL